jgi:hypothetical protein
MPRNGAGTYNPPASTWNPGVNGVTATTADFNALLVDLSAAVTQSVSSDGQTPMTGNLPMGNNKITGLTAGTANTDAVNFSQQVGRLLNVVQFSASNTYTPFTGATTIIVEVIGGGGAGGGCPAAGAGAVAAGGGGGSGGYTKGKFTLPGGTLAVTIGAGGTPGAAGEARWRGVSTPKKSPAAHSSSALWALSLLFVALRERRGLRESSTSSAVLSLLASSVPD